MVKTTKYNNMLIYENCVLMNIEYKLVHIFWYVFEIIYDMQIY